MPKVKAEVLIPVTFYVNVTFECEVEDRDDLAQYACDWASNMIDLQDYQTSLGVECGDRAEKVELNHVGDDCIQDDEIQILDFGGLEE